MQLARLISGLALVVLVNLIAAGAAQGAIRVLGGTATQIQAAPWTVFVAFDLGQQRYVCTGSVIDPSHVLTAAHCLYDPAGNLALRSSVSVEAGVSNFVTPAATDLEQVRSVASFRIHPDYVHPSDGTVASDDVAVLALAAPLDLSTAAVRAVALPAPNAPFPRGAAVTIAGFGLQDPTARFASGALESMTATVDDQGECGESTVSALVLVDNAVILCAAAPASSLCAGDSGSGVVTAGQTPTLIAVADGSTCVSGSPAVSTYLGAAEILRFIEGDDRPPTAPRPSVESIPFRFGWSAPLVPGATLTCSAGPWSTSSVTVAYSFVNSATRDVLQTGAKATYVVPPTAVGTAIECVTDLTSSGGTTVVNSVSTPTITPAPRLRIQQPARQTGIRGRTMTLRVVLIGPPGLSGRVSVCIAPPPAVGRRVCGSRDEPFGTSGTLPISFHLRIKPSAPVGAATIAINASVGASTSKSRVLLRVARR